MKDWRNGKFSSRFICLRKTERISFNLINLISFFHMTLEQFLTVLVPCIRMNSRLRILWVIFCHNEKIPLNCRNKLFKFKCFSLPSQILSCGFVKPNITVLYYICKLWKIGERKEVYDFKFIMQRYTRIPLWIMVNSSWKSFNETKIPCSYQASTPDWQSQNIMQ